MLVKSYFSRIRFLSICLLGEKPDWMRSVCISSDGKLKYLDTLELWTGDNDLMRYVWTRIFFFQNG